MINPSNGDAQPSACSGPDQLTLHLNLIWRAVDSRVMRYFRMNRQRTKTLGIYLLVASLFQICLYLALSVPAKKLDWLFYFDPRIGIFFLESGVRGAEQVTPGIFQWLSAVWILQLVIVVLAGRPWVKTYLISEIILSIPNVFFILTIAWANLTPAHGFSVAELSLPGMVMLAFSVIPLVLAFRVRKKLAGVKWSNPARA